MYTDDILENQFYRFKRDKEVCSVILADIDHFKSVNDDHGHLVGDKVLIEFAKIMGMAIRKGDVLGRWGGEEFLIILPHTNLQEALKLAEKLRKKISENNFPTIGHMSASFGVSTFVEHSSVDILIDTADKALYESKKNGRNCVTTIQIVKEQEL
jgi:diguanylate cyclase (GGDEF)-like protein